MLHQWSPSGTSSGTQLTSVFASGAYLESRSQRVCKLPRATLNLIHQLLNATGHDKVKDKKTEKYDTRSKVKYMPAQHVFNHRPNHVAFSSKFSYPGDTAPSISYG